jgi:hypothetical protein
MDAIIPYGWHTIVAVFVEFAGIFLQHSFKRDETLNYRLLVHCRLLVDVADALLGMVNSDLLLLLHLLAGRGQFPSGYGNTDVHLRTCLHQSSMLLAQYRD